MNAPLPTPLALDQLPPLRLLPAPCSEPPYDDEGGGRTGPTLRLVRPARPVSPAAVPAARPAGLGEPRAVAHALVQRLLEALAGVRPLGQLQRETTPELFERLERLAATRPRGGGVRPASRSVLSVHVQEQPGGVAEACATVRRGARAGAVALRLEVRGDRWCCTDVVGV